MKPVALNDGTQPDAPRYMARDAYAVCAVIALALAAAFTLSVVLPPDGAGIARPATPAAAA
jgi:hypothetical protein